MPRALDACLKVGAAAFVACLFSKDSDVRAVCFLLACIWLELIWQGAERARGYTITRRDS